MEDRAGTQGDVVFPRNELGRHFKQRGHHETDLRFSLCTRALSRGGARTNPLFTAGSGRMRNLQPGADQLRLYPSSTPLPVRRLPQRSGQLRHEHRDHQALRPH